jgi:hypothetical protein
VACSMTCKYMVEMASSSQGPFPSQVLLSYISHFHYCWGPTCLDWAPTLGPIDQIKMESFMLMFQKSSKW